MPDRVLRVLALGAVVTPFVLGLTAAGADRGGREVFAFQDPEIVESSGLVVEGDRAFTINDSGDTGRVFSVDTTTGETVGVTFWEDGPDDVEALAPAGPGHVWVGDIGDNNANRDSIEVTRVPVGDGDRTVDEETIDLVYPDGPRDAEALLAHPVTGRLYVASKTVFGGGLYAAPPELADDAPNVMGLVGKVPGIVTDGSFFPDGDHLILRTYTTAHVYAFPSLELLGSFDLPSQQQGEGIAAVSNTHVWLTSEGQRAPVLSVRLPRDIRSALTDTDSSPTTALTRSPNSSAPPADPEGGATAVDDLSDAAAERSTWWWVVSGLMAVGIVGVLVRAVRPR